MATVGGPAISPLLAPFVSGIHYIEGAVPERLERILPGGRIHLMVNLYEDEFRTYHGPNCATVRRTRGAILGGPNSLASVIDTREQRCLVSVNSNWAVHGRSSEPHSARRAISWWIWISCGDVMALGFASNCWRRARRKRCFG